MFKRYVLLVFLSFQVISSDKPLRVATGNYPPFTGNQLIDDGFVNHIIRLAMATQRIQVEFVYLPWKRSFQSAKLGQFEMASYWVCEPQYQQDFYCSDHVYQGTLKLYFRKETPLPKWQTIRDLQPYRIGAILGYEYVPEFHQAIVQDDLDVIMVSNDQLSLNMLLNERVDLVVLSEIAMQTLLKQHFSQQQASKIQVHPKPFLEYQAHILFPKVREGSTATKDSFNRGLKKLKNSGELQKQWQRMLDGEFSAKKNMQAEKEHKR
ncbi:transporter substrate-binding domain-containing protein [Pseudoalteromonas sp. Of7M-16]|uniref:substrate-binding periplasmic protein n=1 Tax=Pseudoalteromonas sp. Of7M-16 TaxID=2917756 RepID=UPI001EF678D7|nr:transporter substrate-binding domain-containing protein [Pseudoalteromonas sp. Of7M-16]MCG7546834.1 transporter substrate-binding domain-containing protein [Pseudoalteromonas sp. Of7M-16]